MAVVDAQNAKTFKTKQGGAHDVLRAKLLDAHAYADKHAAELNNGVIKTKIGSILHSFFGGAPESGTKQVASLQKQSTSSGRRVITHTPESVNGGGKKKDTTRTRDAQLADKSISELKVIAHKYGITTKGKNHDELIAAISWHIEGEKSDALKALKKAQKKAKKKKAAADAASGTVAKVNIAAGGQDGDESDEDDDDVPVIDDGTRKPADADAPDDAPIDYEEDDDEDTIGDEEE